MKSHVWRITIEGDSCIYNSKIGPVDENHVRTAPSVKAWANGNAILKIEPVFY